MWNQLTPLLLIGGFVINYGGKGVVAMMRILRKIRLTVLSAVLGAFFIMSENHLKLLLLC